MNKLDAITSGSDYNFADKMQRPAFPSSVFKLNHSNVMAFPPNSMGALIPIATFEVVPTDRITLNVRHLLRVLPQVVPLYSKAKIYMHAFFCRTGDCWNVANVYYSKGYNGNTVLKKPVLNSTLCPCISSSSEELVKPTDLLHFLYGLPIGTKYKDYVGKLSAIPYIMYLKIWRDYFANKYFYTENKALLPDDESSFRLNSDGVLISDPTGSLNSSLGLDGKSFLYRDFADDRFTSAMPAPQRGDAPFLENFLHGFLLDDSPLGATYKDMGVLQYKHFNNPVFGASFPLFPDAPETMSGYSFDHYDQAVDALGSVHLNIASSSYSGSEIIQFRTKILLNDIRQLAINQTELEKMARTDGSYSEFGLTFFGVSSKISFDFRPTYIGGTYQPIVFTEVVQTSQSTADSALGQYAGHGISANNGNLGQLYADDFGQVLILASVMPDTLYSQGLDKQFTRLFQAEELLPERAKLGAQPILNKEIYFQGNESDDDLFAYQDIFDEFRYIRSRVTGVLADSTALSYFPYTQSRLFEQLPTFSQSFATTKNNVRMDFLTSQNDPPFTCEFAFDIRAVRPLPYKAVPAQLI